MAAMRGGRAGPWPRDARLDRITRTVRRVLQVPIALLCVTDEEQMRFRSVQGLGPGAGGSARDVTSLDPRDLTFLAYVMATAQPLTIGDTFTSPAFTENPLVIGPPGIRSLACWPLEVVPGIVSGVLCGIDTIPRQFSEDEIAGLKDLARIADGELRAHASAVLQQNLMMRLELAQKRHALDPFTGCWSIRGFRELLGLAVPQAQADHTHLALCQLSVRDVAWGESGFHETGRTSVLSVLAQALRERMAPEGALARLGDLEFCAMVSAPSPKALERQLEPLMASQLAAVLPDGRQIEANITGRAIRLSSLGMEANASKLWGAMLADTCANPFTLT